MLPAGCVCLTHISQNPRPRWTEALPSTAPASSSTRQTIDAINRAVQAAYKAGEEKLRGNGRTVPPLSSLRTPLRDGDSERPDDEAYQGKLFLTARSTTKPGIVDRSLNAVIDPLEVYSGRWARVSLVAFVYSNNGNRGIGMGLQNVQLLEDDEPLGGGRSKPQDDFSAVDDDEDFLA